MIKTNYYKKERRDDMKRKTRNIITISIIILSILSIIGTTLLAKSKITSTKTNSPGITENGGTPPQMPGNNSNQGNGGPENGNGGSTNQGENDSANNQGEPPAKPSDDNKANSSDKTTSSENNSNQENNNMGTPPAMPNNGNQNQSNANSSMDQPNGQSMPSNETRTTKLTTGYYIAFAGESFILTTAIIYLIMSNFNKKDVKETFANNDKKVIAVLSTIILTTALTVGEGMLANKIITNNEPTSNNGNMNNNANANITYSASTEITEDKTITSGTYSSETKDTNALLTSGDITADISNVTVDKTGDSDGGDNTSFYGTNSAILAKSGATLNLKNIELTTNATGANGVFSYGGSATTNNSSSDGTTINIRNSKITTTKDNSGGIMTTGGGVMNAINLTINTAGTSSAAIRTDRGGGTVSVNGGTYTTTGQGSPTIYSTADITVKKAELIAKASEGIVIEGKNSVTIEDTTLTDTNNKLNGQSTTYKNIFLYQSMSGDASNGTATFTAKNSKITTNKGDSFYVTNTTATINLTNNTIINNDESGNFLHVQKDSWGNSGTNGGVVTLNMTNQTATGNIVIDSISTLTMNLKEKASFTGAINTKNEAKSITLKLDKTSQIKLTGDSYVTSLEDEDETYSNIDFNGYTLYVNGTAITK